MASIKLKTQSQYPGYMASNYAVKEGGEIIVTNRVSRRAAEKAARKKK